MKPSSIFVLETSVVAGLGGLAFLKLVRPWYLRWGTTDAVIRRPSPLDERVSKPKPNSTTAITIKAALEDICPWLAQIGDPPRAGSCRYTRAF